MVFLWIIIGLLFIVSLLILWMIKPNKKREIHRMYGREFAHRGLHDDLIPENSLAAFRAARENHFPVELDVQYTKDRQVVVFHDSNLKRMCGIDCKVSELTYEELSSYRLLDTDEKIPLFSEVLNELNGEDIVCEIKHYAGKLTDDLCRDTYELFKDYKGSVVVESFTPFALLWFRKNQPQVIRGQLSQYGKLKNSNTAPLTMFVLRTLLINCISRPDFIAYNFHKTGFCCRLCRKLYHPVYVAWTARGDRERQIARNGFDAVIFEKLEKNIID